MKKTIEIIISLLIGFLGSYVANKATDSESILIVMVSGLFISGIVFLYFVFLHPIIKSYFQLHLVGKIRGLWGNSHLEKLIINEYKNSSEIKIKVTRGSALFKKGTPFYKCVFEENYNENKIIKLLLHFPCLKSEHIIERANANGMTPEKYVDDVLKLLRKFKDHSKDKDQDEKIFIKFYQSDKEKEWRYYIFNKHNNTKTLLFNHYNKKIAGAKSKMLKVKSGNDSLCDDLNKSFNNLFEFRSLELIENILKSKKLVNSDNCGHPKCRTLIQKSYTNHFNN